MPFDTKHGIKPITAIVLSVAVFVLLDLSLLALNFHIAQQIDEDSLAINLAGRQRMLSQQMAKLVLESQLIQEDSARWSELQHEIAASQNLFNTTLEAFLNGGQVSGSDGEPSPLRARTDAEVRSILLQAETIWQDYQQTLLAPISNPVANVDLTHADLLLSTVNQLTTVLEHQAREKAALLRRYQSAAVMLVLLNLGIILWQIRRRFQTVSTSNLMLRDMVDRMSTAVLLFNNTESVGYANKAAGLLFGISESQLIGKFREELLQTLEGTIIGVRHDGEQFDANVEEHELVFEDIPVQILTITDITDHKQKDSHWRHLAYHDALTGLPNRLYFEHRVKHELSTAHRRGEIVAFLLVDLDNFKDINDNHGHIVGDKVLRVISKRFQNKVREEDLVARLGGDEFVVVVGNFKSISAAQQKVKDLCEILMQAMSEPVPIIDDEVFVRGSIGVSFYPSDGDALDDILHHSDISMYRSKSVGGGCEFLLQQQELI